MCELLACPKFEIKCVSLRFLVLCDHTGDEGRSSEEAVVKLLLSGSSWGCRVNLSYAGAASLLPRVCDGGGRQTVVFLGIKCLQAFLPIACRLLECL